MSTGLVSGLSIKYFLSDQSTSKGGTNYKIFLGLSNITQYSKYQIQGLLGPEKPAEMIRFMIYFQVRN